MYYHTGPQIWYSSDDPLTYMECDDGEDFSCAYLGYSPDDHLNYMGLYENCPDTSPKPTTQPTTEPSMEPTRTMEPTTQPTMVPTQSNTAQTTATEHEDADKESESIVADSMKNVFVIVLGAISVIA